MAADILHELPTGGIFAGYEGIKINMRDVIARKALQFRNKVTSLLDTEDSRAKFFEALRYYHQSPNVKKLVRDLKHVLNTEKKYSLFKEIRALIPEEHLKVYDKLVKLNKRGERLIRLKRINNEPMGFTFRGGKEHGVGFFITSVTLESPASQVGLKVGDEIRKINGLPLYESLHDEVLAIFRNDRIFNLVVRNDGRVPTKMHDEILWTPIEVFEEASKERPPLDDEPSIEDPVATADRYISVNLEGSEGLGCSIDIDVNGHSGVYVVSVEKSSLAEHAGLKVGDQILNVCGKEFDGVTYDEAIESLQSESILTVIARYNESVAESLLGDEYSKLDNIKPILVKEPRTEKNAKSAAFGSSVVVEYSDGDDEDEQEREKEGEGEDVIVPDRSNFDYPTELLEGREVHYIAIEKDGTLGMNLENKNNKIAVHNVLPGGAVDRHAFLESGDWILSCEGYDLMNIPLSQAQTIISMVMQRWSKYIEFIVACPAGRISPALPSIKETSSIRKDIKKMNKKMLLKEGTVDTDPPYATVMKHTKPTYELLTTNESGEDEKMEVEPITFGPSEIKLSSELEGSEPAKETRKNVSLLDMAHERKNPSETNKDISENIELQATSYLEAATLSQYGTAWAVEVSHTNEEGREHVFELPNELTTNVGHKDSSKFEETIVQHIEIEEESQSRDIGQRKGSIAKFFSKNKDKKNKTDITWKDKFPLFGGKKNRKKNAESTLEEMSAHGSITQRGSGASVPAQYKSDLLLMISENKSYEHPITFEASDDVSSPNVDILPEEFFDEDDINAVDHVLNMELEKDDSVESTDSVIAKSDEKEDRSDDCEGDRIGIDIGVIESEGVADSDFSSKDDVERDSSPETLQVPVVAVITEINKRRQSITSNDSILESTEDERNEREINYESVEEMNCKSAKNVVENDSKIEDDAQIEQPHMGALTMNTEEEDESNRGIKGTIEKWERRSSQSDFSDGNVLEDLMKFRKRKASLVEASARNRDRRNSGLLEVSSRGTHDKTLDETDDITTSNSSTLHGRSIEGSISIITSLPKSDPEAGVVELIVDDESEEIKPGESDITEETNQFQESKIIIGDEKGYEEIQHGEEINSTTAEAKSTQPFSYTEPASSFTSTYDKSIDSTLSEKDDDCQGIDINENSTKKGSSKDPLTTPVDNSSKSSSAITYPSVETYESTPVKEEDEQTPNEASATSHQVDNETSYTIPVPRSVIINQSRVDVPVQKQMAEISLEASKMSQKMFRNEKVKRDDSVPNSAFGQFNEIPKNHFTDEEIAAFQSVKQKNIFFADAKTSVNAKEKRNSEELKPSKTRTDFVDSVKTNAQYSYTVKKEEQQLNETEEENTFRTISDLKNVFDDCSSPPPMPKEIVRRYAASSALTHEPVHELGGFLTFSPDKNTKVNKVRHNTSLFENEAFVEIGKNTIATRKTDYPHKLGSLQTFTPNPKTQPTLGSSQTYTHAEVLSLSQHSSKRGKVHEVPFDAISDDSSSNPSPRSPTGREVKSILLRNRKNSPKKVKFCNKVKVGTAYHAEEDASTNNPGTHKSTSDFSKTPGKTKIVQPSPVFSIPKSNGDPIMRMKAHEEHFVENNRDDYNFNLQAKMKDSSEAMRQAAESLGIDFVEKETSAFIKITNLDG